MECILYSKCIHVWVYIYIACLHRRNHPHSVHFEEHTQSLFGLVHAWGPCSHNGYIHCSERIMMLVKVLRHVFIALLRTCSNRKLLTLSRTKEEVRVHVYLKKTVTNKHESYHNSISRSPAIKLLWADNGR